MAPPIIPLGHKPADISDRDQELVHKILPSLAKLLEYIPTHLRPTIVCSLTVTVAMQYDNPSECAEQICTAIKQGIEQAVHIGTVEGTA